MAETTIGLAGNPNCGKTTLFNELTGSNGYVGNWPGVTVEKKQATWRQDKSVTFVDLPGIYSLSPYTLHARGGGLARLHRRRASRRRDQPR